MEDDKTLCVDQRRVERLVREREKSHTVRGYLLPGGTLLHRAYQHELKGGQGGKKKGIERKVMGNAA